MTAQRTTWKKLTKRRPAVRSPTHFSLSFVVLVCVVLIWAVEATLGTALVEAATKKKSGAECARCDWRPPQPRQVLLVKSSGELQSALRRAPPGATVLIADGEYLLDRSLDISVPNLVLRSRSGDRDKVTLRCGGMDEERVGSALSVSASDVTIADLTVGWVGNHGVQVRGEKGASRTVLHNLRVVDAGQQLIKGSFGYTDQYADDCLVACSLLEYTRHAPSDYTNGVDVLGGNNWIVRDNRFVNIRGPESGGWKAGPAILFWANSSGTVVERNVVVDCYRGIALGIGAGVSRFARERDRRYDHQQGVIRNNVVVNRNEWADEGIEVNACRDVTVEHNTVLNEGKLSWSIGLRFPMTTGRVRNNLTNRRIALRNNAKAEMSGNVSKAQSDWFIDAENFDLRLARPNLPAVDTATPLAGIDLDAARQPRRRGKTVDAGAYEYFPGQKKHTPNRPRRR